MWERRIGEGRQGRGKAALTSLQLGSNLCVSTRSCTFAKSPSFAACRKAVSLMAGSDDGDDNVGGGPAAVAAAAINNMFLICRVLATSKGVLPLF